MNSVLMLELGVGILVSFTLLGIFIWAIKDGQFEDKKRIMDGLLYDSEDDLRSAVEREEKAKKLREKKQKSMEKSSKNS